MTDDLTQTSFSVVQYTKEGKFIGTVVGIGRKHKGTLDTAHPRRTAQVWAKKLREQNPDYIYRVVENGYPL